MEKTVLNVDIREATGKEANKKLRVAGSVPGVLYQKGQKATSLKMDARELFHVLRTSAGENVIITLKIKSTDSDKAPGKDRTVIIKEIQYEPIKGDVLHLDFSEISLTDKIEVNIPIDVKGEPIGVKTDGGVLDNPLKELHIECLPTNIPEHIILHVDELNMNDSIKVKDLEIPEGVTVLSDLEQTVVSVMPPRVEEEVSEEEEAEESQEPEVIGEKKSDDAEGSEPAPGAKEAKKEE